MAEFNESVSRYVSQGAIPKKQKLTKQHKEEDEYYIMNALLVASLLPFIGTTEREPVQKWMKKFNTMHATQYERMIRNDYIWFLLIQLESGVVTLPFIHNPPQGDLKPVADAIDKVIYEDVLRSANYRSAYLDDIPIPSSIYDSNNLDETFDKRQVKPSEFLENQPKPKFGFIAYGACFSDQK